jgi:hypothetical protein
MGPGIRVDPNITRGAEIRSGKAATENGDPVAEPPQTEPAAAEEQAKPPTEDAPAGEPRPAEIPAEDEEGAPAA